VLYKLKDRISRLRFFEQCKAVLQSAPVALDPPCNLALLSQLQHKDVLMFLLAIKSFAREVRPGAVFVLDDGSVRAGDRELLKAHVPGIEFLELPPYRSPACPAGGCWERLLAIASLVSDYYVIQLDSDTLTVGPIAEVRGCVEQGTAFALGTWDRQTDESMVERSESARRLQPSPHAHVQLVAEANFDALKDFRSLRYVRGCAGFGGFPRQSFSRSFVEAISSEMRAAIGAKWAEWGSEQVMSNIVLANIPGSMVLPHPKYADCQKMRAGETAFIHFIGSCRFDNGIYARLGNQVIAAL
jgi:hypothetical protein